MDCHDLNSDVRIRLAEAGEQTYKEYLRKGGQFLMTRQEDGSWVTWLWLVMAIFGMKLAPTQPDQFEDNFIEFL